MATKEYTELQLKAKDEGIKSWHVKSDDQLSEELAAKWENDAVNSETEEKTEEEAPEETPEETPEVEGNVTFYWKNGRDVEFSVETVAATATTARQAEWFYSQDSVLVLDPRIAVQAKAIEKLRKDPKYKVEFAEVAHRRAAVEEKGARLDELMELDHSVLVQMVGGSVQDHRKSKGELITQIMDR